MDQQYNKLGDILKNHGLLTEAQLKAALAKQDQRQEPLGKILVEARMISEEDLAKALAFQKNLDLVDLDDYEVDLAAVGLINEEAARRHKAIPISFDQGKLVVAVADPLDVHAMDSVQVLAGKRIKPVVATETGVIKAINLYMKRDPAKIRQTVKEAKQHIQTFEKSKSPVAAGPNMPVIELADTILRQAVHYRASDIHVESEEDLIRVRYRIDGVLQDSTTLPIDIQQSLISRFKIIFNMDITERRRPQDGRAKLFVDGHEVSLRGASIPSVHGENITVRLLGSGQTLTRLEELGFNEKLLAKYRQAYSSSYGAIINTGPTGSGKTTTLYATINALNTPDKKIITIEDPIEHAVRGVTQMQINRRAGIDFEVGLRAIVRSDPDIVMIGEIRDLETVQMAIRAALTGHLVLSSLHTNDASTALTRLIDMGVDAYMVTWSVRCVLAQRLARLLCPHCKQPAGYDKDTLAAFGVDVKTVSPDVFYKPTGCGHCQRTGFHGRIGLFELLLVTDTIDKLCVTGATSSKIRQAAIGEGMRTIYHDGLEKAASGLVSIEEVRRVVL